jgi:thiosulfate dehydrogenase
MQKTVLWIAGLIALFYVGAIVAGLRVHDWTGWDRIPGDNSQYASLKKMNWRPPSQASIPAGAKGDSIRLGMALFDETPLYGSRFARARVSCQSCHAEGGMQPFAGAMVGVPATFPQFNVRAAKIISLEDRIQECFVRSENGQPLDYKGREMRALVDYITWLSQPEPDRKPFVGRGLVKIADLTPDPVRGKAIYAEQCAGCHGENGEGKPHVFPPLWGPDSFNDGAGMHGVKKMAAFVQHNMPQNRMGMLSAQEAWDVAAFVHQQPRPAFDQRYKHF